MKKQNSLLSLLLGLALIGCSKNPAENVPAADVKSPATNVVAEAAATSAPARVFVFGPSNSSVGFTGSKVTGKHDGGFRQFTGELSVVNGKLANIENKVVIDTRSIYSDSDRLTGHLKNKDFFDVAKFPTATFETISIETGATNSTVTGNLTLHGITKQISFPALVEVAPDAVSVTSEFFLNRHDFEMKYGGKPDDLVRKEVVLRLKVKATPK